MIIPDFNTSPLKFVFMCYTGTFPVNRKLSNAVDASDLQKLIKHAWNRDVNDFNIIDSLLVGEEKFFCMERMLNESRCCSTLLSCFRLSALICLNERK